MQNALLTVEKDFFTMALRGSNFISSMVAAPRAEKPVDPQIAKGQTTAIVTGAISIIFGVRQSTSGRAGLAGRLDGCERCASMIEEGGAL